jgi:hypothetical protein
MLLPVNGSSPAGGAACVVLVGGCVVGGCVVGTVLPW